MQAAMPDLEATRSPGAADTEATRALDSSSVFAEIIHSLLHEAWTLVQDHALLTVLEAQRASRTVTRMLFAGVVAAVLLVTAWLALVGSVLFWVVADDQALAYGLLAIGLIHLALSAAIIWWIRRLASHQMFASLVRQLSPPASAPGESA